MTTAGVAGWGAILAGTAILVRLLRPCLRLRFLYRMSERWKDAHRALFAVLYRRDMLRFPGILLVDPLRPWLAGEAVFLAILLSTAVLSSSPIRHLSSAVPAGAASGLSVSVLLFRSGARRKLDEVLSELPTAAFLLSLLLDAGMGNAVALRETRGALASGPLALELERIERAREFGMPLPETLEASCRRVPMEEYRNFLNLIRQGERLGTGLSRGLRELSAGLLESRACRAETEAQRAAVKLLLPLALFIFPAVFLVILSPVVLDLLDSAENLPW